MSDYGFEYLIAPYSLSEFLNNFYSRGYLHIKRNNSKYYEEIYSSLKFDKTLNDNTHTTKYLRLAKFGEKVDPRKYSFFDKFDKEYQISIENVIDKYKEGYSIVLDDLSRVERRVQNLERDMAKKIPFVDSVCSNVYLTPENSQAFPLHYDIQEVFIIQIYGSKIWELYPGVEELNPIDYSYDYLLNNLEKDTIPKKITLNEGDLLYLPRGYGHKVYSKENSLHITISLYPFTNKDFIDEIIDEIIRSQPFFTKTLTSNVNIVKDKLIEEVKKCNLQGLLNRVQSKSKYHKFLPSDLHLNSLLELNLENIEQSYRLRGGININSVGQTTLFKHGDKEVEIDGDFSFLNQMNIFQITDLFKFIGKDIAKELIFYLLNEGFLTTEIEPKG